MKTNHFPALKIGRINKRMEEAMAISLASDMAIYVEDAMLDQLARDYPSSYLLILEEIKEAIRKPDAFSFSLKKNELTFIRLYSKQSDLYALSASVISRGRPKKWVLAHLRAIKDLRQLQREKDEEFIRLP